MSAPRGMVHPKDVVRVLDDPHYGYSPVGHVEKVCGKLAKVIFDKPIAGREHEWRLVKELEVVDLEKWEAMISDA